MTPWTFRGCSTTPTPCGVLHYRTCRTEATLTFAMPTATHALRWGGCLSSLGQALGFPQYCGKNPDAFIECLGDLLIRTDSSFLGSEFGDRLGVDREAVLLVVDPGMGFLSRANSSERDSFFSIIDAVIMEPLTPDFMGSETADEDPTARSVPFAVAMII